MAVLRKKKGPGDLLREFARELRRGMTAAAFVIWCELLRQELGCLKSERARVQAIDDLGEIMTDYLAGLPAQAAFNNIIADRIDLMADNLKRVR